MKVNGKLVFDASAVSEIQNLRVEKVSANPTAVAADVGRLIYNTATKTIYIGSEPTAGNYTWTSLATGGNAAALQAEVDALEASLGSIVGADGVWAGTSDFAGGSLIAVISAIKTAITAEASTRASAESTLTTNLAAEVTRATGAESTLTTNLAAEVTRATGAESTLTTNLAAEVTRATGVEGNIQAELDAAELAVGLTATGTLGPFAAGGYATGKTSFKAAVEAIDAALKAEEAARASADTTLTNNLATEVTARTNADAAIQTELDAVEAGAGLNTNGTYTASVGSNYASTATSLKKADELIDAALKAEVTRAVAEEVDIRADFAAADSALQNTLQANINGKVAKAGDSMTGNLAMQTHKVTGLGAPTAAEDAATKGYVDSLIAGLTWEAPVNGIVATYAALPASPTAGDRYYVTNDDKIYTYSTTWDSGETVVDGAAFFNKSDETGYVYSGSTLVQFTSTGQVTAGIGLVKTGNVIDVNLGAGIAQLPSDEVGIDLFGTGGLFLTVDGSTASTASASQLAVKLDGASIVRSADGIKVSGTLTTEIAALRTDLTSEASTRATADTALQTAITNEATARSNADTALQTELDAVETAVGLTATGTLTSFATGGHASSQTTVKAAIEAVDAALVTAEAGLASEISRATAAEGALQSELNATQAGAGLSAAGAYVAHAGANYIVSATTLDGADVLLDTALKAEVTRATTAEGVLTTNLAAEVTRATGVEAAITARINKMYYLHDQATAATTWSVTHNIGQKYCSVTVVDDTDNVIIPESIVFTSTSALTVTFNTAVAGKVVVMGLV